MTYLPAVLNGCLRTACSAFNVCLDVLRYIYSDFWIVRQPRVITVRPQSPWLRDPDLYWLAVSYRG